MAEKPADSKVGSAVSSKPQLQNTSTSDSGMNEDGESRASTDSPKLTGDAIPKKRSTFKITGVVIGHATPNSRGGSGDLTADVDGDSLDDLDESHTEDFSSEMYDMSRTTELDQDVLLTPDEVSLIASKEKPDSQSRFKVVKIETKEPFRRGRWYCHDFLDTTVDKPDKQTDEITVHSGSSSAGNSVHYVHGVDDPSKNPLLAGGTGTIPVMTGTEPYIPVQGESFKPIHPAPHASQTVASQLINQPQRQSTPGLPGDSNQISSQVPNNSSVVGQLKPGMSSVQGGSNQPSPGQSNSTTNVVPQNMNAQTVPHMPQSINVNLKQSELSQSSPVPGNLTGQVTNTMQPGAHYSESGFSSQNYNMTNTPGQTQSSQPPMGQGATPANVPKVNNATSVEATPNVTQNPMGIQSQQSNTGATQTLKPALSSGNLAGMQVNHMSGQEPNMENISSGDVVSSSTRRASVIGTSSTDQDGNPCTAEDLQNLVQESSGIPELAGPLLNAVSGRESPAKETKGGESDSGSSAVAIDNKIEQAMDLVKSHLMFAVREEVEVLKEQIKELVEKITQLEYENNVLKAAATPETLAKLQTQKALPPSSSS